MSSDAFRKYLSAEAVEASFATAYLIVLAKKSHNIGERFMKSCMLKAASLVLVVANREELAKISFSDFTVKTRIDEIAWILNFKYIKK